MASTQSQVPCTPAPAIQSVRNDRNDEDERNKGDNPFSDISNDINHVEFFEMVLSAKSMADMDTKRVTFEWNGHKTTIDPNMPSLTRKDLKLMLDTALAHAQVNQAIFFFLYIIIIFLFIQKSQQSGTSDEPQEMSVPSQITTPTSPCGLQKSSLVAEEARKMKSLPEEGCSSKKKHMQSLVILIPIARTLLLLLRHLRHLLQMLLLKAAGAVVSAAEVLKTRIKNLFPRTVMVLRLQKYRWEKEKG